MFCKGNLFLVFSRMSPSEIVCTSCEYVQLATVSVNVCCIFLHDINIRCSTVQAVQTQSCSPETKAPCPEVYLLINESKPAAVVETLQAPLQLTLEHRKVVCTKLHRPSMDRYVCGENKSLQRGYISYKLNFRWYKIHLGKKSDSLCTHTVHTKFGSFTIKQKVSCLYTQ